MPRVVVVKHIAHEGPGLFGELLEQAGVALCTVDVFRGADRLPDPSAFDGLLVMGGPMNADEDARYPFLAEEKAWLRRCLDAELPVIGICLGAQLLARVLGAQVYPAKEKEIGWYPVYREAAAAGDALCSGFKEIETVFQWHGDTFAMPEGAVRLFSSPQCENQAFRYGSFAWGFQFHIELTTAMLDEWLEIPSMRLELEQAEDGFNAAAIRERAARHSNRCGTLSAEIITAFHRNMLRVAR